jgi:carbon starvation protein
LISYIVIISVIFLSLAYRFYGKYLSKKINLDDSQLTPAAVINDGNDFIPTKPQLLLGQHFSAIAAAGPIVGPILAGLWFGWLPALLWILIGSVFIGGVHDFTSLVASIRHKARSIAELLKLYMSRTSYLLFLFFIWITLVYVIIAFTDITAQTFLSLEPVKSQGPGVAAASFFYIIIAVILGILIYKFKVNLKLATGIFIPVFIVVVYLCAYLPEPVVNMLAGINAKQWDIIVLIYCLIASVLPMWILLQPRGYLGGWFLYLTIAISLAGSLFGGLPIQYPALNLEGFSSVLNGKNIFPILFITVACGACSGFHAIVSSGTTAKQIRRETDTKSVGYGSMLLEGIVAVFALSAVMMTAKGSGILNDDPNVIYAKGIASYLNLIGFDYNLAVSFALLAFATFVYDTLDVCTRLGRYILQELFEWRSKSSAFTATALTLALPAVFLLSSEEKAYVAAWSAFGTSNQLLASLVLLAVSVWLLKTGRKFLYAVIPMIFMMIMTLWSLILLISPVITSFRNFSALNSSQLISGITGIVLLVMSGIIIAEAIKIFILDSKSVLTGEYQKN